MENRKIEISEDEYDSLIADQIFLQCLIRAGVQNWDGYEVAVEYFEE